MPRANNHGEPDTQVIEGARCVLVKHGYVGLTLERIAEEAGLSRITLYRRGLSKDKIFDALVAQTAERYPPVMWPALTAPGTAAERLREAVEAQCAYSEENIEVLLALRAQIDSLYHRGEGAPQQMSQGLVLDPLERILRDGATDGTLRPTDPHEASILLHSWVGWTYVHLRTAYGWQPERIRALLIERIMDSFATGEATTGVEATQEEAL